MDAILERWHVIINRNVIEGLEAMQITHTSN